MSIIFSTPFQIGLDAAFCSLALLSGGDQACAGPSTEIPEIASTACSRHSWRHGLTTKQFLGHRLRGIHLRLTAGDELCGDV